MAQKKATSNKTTVKSTLTVKQVAIEGIEADMTQSEKLAVLVANSQYSAARTLTQYAGTGEAMQVNDLMAQMKKIGHAVVGGDLTSMEKVLVNQALTLDAMFNDLAQRAARQDTFKGIEVLMRLGLKAQAQARSTIEALALVKNPMPYIRQANIANGPQQVNNGNASASGHTGISAHSGAHQNTAIANDGASGFTDMTTQSATHQKAVFSEQHARTPTRG